MPKGTNAIADALQPAAKANLLAALRAMAANVSVPKLTLAINNGNIADALTAVKAVQFPAHLKGLADVIEKGFIEAAKETMQPFVVADPTFTIKNPLAQAAADWSGQKITLITDQTRTAIRQIIRKGLTEGVEPAKLAKEIKPLIGLNARQAVAVQNARARWLKQGMTEAAIEKAAGTYTERLRKYRALTIARTETIGSTNRGQLHTWRNAQKNGLLDPNLTNRRWLAAKGSGRTCPICNAMHKQEVLGLHAMFTLPNGQQLQHPPAHPSCRCSVAIVVAKSTAKLPSTFGAPPVPPDIVPPVLEPSPNVIVQGPDAVAEQMALADAAKAAKIAAAKKAKYEYNKVYYAKKRADARAAKLAAKQQVQGAGFNPNTLSYDEFEKADKALGGDSGFYEYGEAPKAKAKIMQDLAKRLENSPATFKIPHGTYSSGPRARPFNMMSASERESITDDIVRTWAATSGDHDVRAVAMQLAIKDEFGLSASDLSHFTKEIIKDAHDEYTAYATGYRAIARAMHDNTQEYFRARGITHLTLVRGARYQGTLSQAQGWGDILLQPASSFASDINTSIGFGSTMHVVRVPVSQILGSARTGFGCFSEHEFVVLGGKLRGWTSQRLNILPGRPTWEWKEKLVNEWKAEIEAAMKKGTP